MNYIYNFRKVAILKEKTEKKKTNKYVSLLCFYVNCSKKIKSTEVLENHCYNSKNYSIVLIFRVCIFINFKLKKKKIYVIHQFTLKLYYKIMTMRKLFQQLVLAILKSMFRAILITNMIFLLFTIMTFTNVYYHSIIIFDH